MTDCEPAPVAVADFAALDRQEHEHSSRADELLPANKTTLFDALAAANITAVVVTFDGYGDSGQIENIEAKAGDEIVTLPPGTIEIAHAMWGSNDIANRTITLDYNERRMESDYSQHVF